MYFQKGDEVEVNTDDYKLDNVRLGDIGVYEESMDGDDLSQSIAKVIFPEDKVVYIPETCLCHTDLELAQVRFEAVSKQAEEFAKSKGIELPDRIVPESETVAKPTRYNTGEIEVWDAIRLLGLDYMQGNVVKYTARYRNKNGSQDLFKALNYLVKIMSTELDEDFYELRTKTVDELSVICERNGNGKTQEIS
jgi:hypothetical protein